MAFEVSLEQESVILETNSARVLFLQYKMT